MSEQIKVEFLGNGDQIEIEIDGQLQTVEVDRLTARHSLVDLYVVGRSEPVTFARSATVALLSPVS